jgi:hypothetical protein
MANAEPTPGAFGLAQRLRELRVREFRRLTQADLGQALGDANDAPSPATISMWENPASGRLPPPYRLEAYARFFCTPRSLERKLHMLSDADLTVQERERMDDLKGELLSLRKSAAPAGKPSSSGEAQSIWHFPDGSRITLVCSRLSQERRRPPAQPDDLNYVRLSDLADLDTLIDIYGAIRAHNPTSRVVIVAAQDLTERDVSNHLVLIGGLAWSTVTPWFSRIFKLPIQPEDPAVRGAIVVNDANGEEVKFSYTLDKGSLVEDVGFFVRGKNPSAPQRTLTICGGITTLGVHGSARCCIDWEMRERNDRYLKSKLSGDSPYCVVMRVPIVNKDPLTPDLSKEENRLFEWSGASLRPDQEKADHERGQ